MCNMPPSLPLKFYIDNFHLLKHLVVSVFWGMLSVSFQFSSIIKCLCECIHTKSLATFAGHHQGSYCSQAQMSSRSSTRSAKLSLFHSSRKPWQSLLVRRFIITGSLSEQQTADLLFVMAYTRVYHHLLFKPNMITYK